MGAFPRRLGIRRCLMQRSKFGSIVGKRRNSRRRSLLEIHISFATLAPGNFERR
jgi:hypothetical protein